MQSQEWLPVSQAAKQVGRSRQTIDALARSGKLECKPMGDKDLIHIHIPTLIKHYSDKSLQTPISQKDSHKDSQFDLQIEVVSVKGECKRLADLLSMNERLLSDAKHELKHVNNELTKERNKNESLQTDLLKITKEMQAILNKDSGLTSWIRTLRK